MDPPPEELEKITTVQGVLDWVGIEGAADDLKTPRGAFQDIFGSRTLIRDIAGIPDRDASRVLETATMATGSSQEGSPTKDTLKVAMKGRFMHAIRVSRLTLKIDVGPVPGTATPSRPTPQGRRAGQPALRSR